MNNTRYDKLLNKIKQWHKEGSQDDLILRSLYDQVALEQNGLVDRSEDLTKETKYSNLSEKDFTKLFKTKNFTPLDETDIKHLFQELHNRYMNDKGFDVTRHVAVVNNPEQSAYGYVCYSDDLMFINKGAIDKAKTIEPSKSNFNKTNIGHSLMFIIMHESHHVTQYETAIDFALGKKQNEEDAFLGAMGVVKNTNFAISDKNQDKFIDEWRNNYDYRFVEHNANYSAFKKADSVLSAEDKKGEAFDQYTLFTGVLSLRGNKIDRKFIENRVNKMEEVAKKEIEYFNKGTTNCPMKDKVMKVVDEYLKVDENGNSKFRDLMTKQVTELADAYNKAKLNQDERLNAQYANAL